MRVLAAVLAMASIARAEELVLFDPTGAEPPHLVFLTFPTAKVRSTFVTGPALAKLETQRAELAGLTSIPRLLPELGDGVELEFELQLTAEAHGKSDDNKDGRADRAGFSVVLLDRELHGIELGFWPKRIWAQDDGKALFTQAEGVETDPGTLTKYTLKLAKNRYILSREGAPLLEGKTRDYSAFNGTPNPYCTKNYVFLGDNSSRSASTALLGRIVLRAP